MNKITVCIGTHNREKNLIKVIKEFNKIKKLGKFNLLIIDSSDKKLNLKNKEDVLYIYDKSLKSLSKKRNLAIKLCKTSFLLFTDDDCIPHKEWVKEMEARLRDYVCVTGQTLQYKDTRNTEFEEKFGFSKIGNKNKVIRKRFLLNPWRIGHGNNMGFQIEIFKKIGEFDENLGVGSDGLAGEDTNMFLRVLERGKIFYNSKAIIYHNHLVKSEDLGGMAYRNGYGSYKVLIKGRGINLKLIWIYGLIRGFFRELFKPNEINKNILLGWVGVNKRKGEEK